MDAEVMAVMAGDSVGLLKGEAVELAGCIGANA